MNKYLRFTVVSLFLLCLLLGVGEFISFNEFVGEGKEIKETDQKIESLQEQNALLSQKIASASSLLTISEKATSLGLVETKRVITMGEDQFMVAMTINR